MGKGFRRLAVIGAGNMGSGIAQKMSTEGFHVLLVDLDDEKVARGIDGVRRSLAEAVERKIMRPEKTEAILSRLTGTTDWSDLADVDLAVEAVFEDPQVKREVFERLDRVCREDAILATNTSSLSVTKLAAETRHPERVIGLHYFYHPAKNRLVEVVPGRATDPEALRAAWNLQEQIGKTPIASADVSGFVVNRYFVPWLNEAVRLLEEGLADIPTIEAACKKTFAVGMGPFELMNVTGVPIALHAATTLGAELGSFYAPAEKLRQQVDSGKAWEIGGDANGDRLGPIADRMLAVVYYVASALVEEGVATLEDADIGARVGLRWRRGPFEMMNRTGVDRCLPLVKTVTDRWKLEVPAILTRQADLGERFAFRLVKSELRDGVATLTLNRPDTMNALNEEMVDQLHRAFKAAAGDANVRGIVIAGSGKAFVAGADVRFFVRNLESGDVDRIVNFTKAGHDLLNEIGRCPKPVVARLQGPALGGGLELALACDRIVASPRATLAFPETGIGIYPGLGGTQRTPRKIGVGLAKWLIYTGQSMSAEQARVIGLVDDVVAHENLDEAAAKATAQRRQSMGLTWPIAFAKMERFFGSNSADDLRVCKADAGDDEALLEAMKRVASKAPLALRIAEQLIEKGAECDLEVGLQMELDRLEEILSTADAREGLSSAGKRKPVFKGH